MENKLNLAQRLYSGHFPELLKMDPDRSNYEFYHPFGNGKIVIESDGMCTINDNNGFVTDLFMSLEGMTKDDSFQYYQNLISGVKPPDISTIKEWNYNLITYAEYRDELNYLISKRKLNELTLKEHLIGFDKSSNCYSFPILNATGHTTSMVKLFNPLNNISPEINGHKRLFGYHELKKKATHKTVFITFDEFDALLLRQSGYFSVCPISENNELDDEWISLFKPFSEIIIIKGENRSADTTKIQSKVKGDVKLIELDTEYLSDINEDIRNFIERKISGYEEEKIIQDKLSKLEDIEFLESVCPGAQAFINNQIIYGIKSKDVNRFISSDGNIFTEEEIKSSLKISPKDFYSSNIDKSLVRKFLSRSLSICSNTLHNEISDYIRRYVFFKDDSVYDLLAAWVMGTYIFRIFSHYPYIHLQAEKDSGKSLLTLILEPICFNGNIEVDSTGASLFRYIDRNSPTLFLDEAEKFGKSQKVSPTIMSVLNAGFSSGGRIARSAKEGVLDYDVYCPKIFSGINDLNDVLESRTIKVKILRKLRKEVVKKYNSIKNIDLLKQLRENLYAFGLSYAAKINESYLNLDSNPYLSEINNRLHDIWSPLFAISSVIDFENNNSSVSDSLSKYLLSELQIHKDRDLEENDTLVLFRILDNALNNVQPIKKETSEGGDIYKYRTDDIFNFVIGDKKENKLVDSKYKLTSSLRKKLNISNEVTNISGKTERCYIISVKNLVDLAERFEFNLSFINNNTSEN